MEFWDLTDKEFKIDIMKKLNEIQEDLERQFNEVRNKISEQKEYFANQIEILKMNQTEILELCHEEWQSLPVCQRGMAEYLKHKKQHR